MEQPAATVELIFRYFPDLTPVQQEQFRKLFDVYSEWNTKINVISRKDIEYFYVRHVLHSLLIARYISFRDGTKIMDLGTGGGFPGVPLAVLFPQCRFHLVDSIGKKLTVIQSVAESIGLNNIKTFHARAEDSPYTYDFVVSRAVAPFTDLAQWTKGKYNGKSLHDVPNGLICLKGLQIDDPKPRGSTLRCVPLKSYSDDPFFEEKALYHVTFPKGH